MTLLISLNSFQSSSLWKKKKSKRDEYMAQMHINILHLCFTLPNVMILNERLELGTPRNGHVQCLSRKETLRVEEVEEIIVH